MKLLVGFALIVSLVATPAVSAKEDSTEHIQRAAAFIAQGDLDAAEKEARLALANPVSRPLGYASLGAIRMRQKKLTESRQFLEKAIGLNPNLLGARITLAQVYALEGKPDLARKSFQQAVKIDPQNPAPRLSLAQFEAANKNYTASLDLIAPMESELRKSPDGLILLLVAYLGTGQIDAARSVVKDWLALVGEIPDNMVIEFAKPLVENGLAADAVLVLDKARGVRSPSFEIAFALGGACLANGDHNQASAYYEQAASLNNRCVYCFRQVAAISEQDGEKEKALSFLIKAKLLEPENPEILFDFGRVCLQTGLVRDALPALEEAARLRPGDDRYAYALAAALIGRNRKDDAIGVLDRLVKKHPDDPTMNFAMGAALHIAGTDLDGAESYLRKSIRLKPDQVGAYHILGMVMVKKGDEDQAARIFRDLLERSPDYLPSLEQFGAILVKQRKYDEAREILEKLLRMEPNSLTGHYQYSLLLGRLGKPEESAQHREIAQKLEAEERTKARTELILLNPH